MKRPLARVVVWYITGLVIADSVPLPLMPLLGLTALTAAIALLWSPHRSGLLPIALLLAGAANFTQDTASFRPADLRNLTPNEPIEIRLRGVLAAAPVTQPNLNSGKPGKPRCAAEIQSSFLKRPGHPWQPAWGGVKVSTGGLLPETYQGGMEVEIRGVMQRPPAAAAPGLFDYQAHLKRKGIHRLLNVRDAKDWQARSRAFPPELSARFQTWAMETLAMGLPKDDPIVGLIWAMTLGWRQALAGEISESFMRSGTMHVFAISGLHVVLITAILGGLLRFLRLSRSACAWILLPALWFYAAVTGWQASAVRAILMTSVILAGWLLRRPGDPLNSLAAAGLFLLLWEPQQLFQVGFQLSFAVVLSLILLDAVFKPMRAHLAASDPMRPVQFLTWWQRQLNSGRRWLVMAATSSLAAWLGSLPLVAYYFHFFTPVSLLANLFVIPMSGLALCSALGSLLTGAWCPGAALLFNNSAWFWMKIMTLFSEWCVSLPGAWFHVAWPGVTAVALYYTALAGAVGWRTKQQHRFLAPLLGLLSLGTFWQWHRQNAFPVLTILPAGGATALYLSQPALPTDTLIDCGTPEAVEQTVLPFLRAHGVDQLPLLVLTHGDQQHISGAPALAQHIPIEQLCLGPTPFRSSTYRNIQQTWQQAGHLRTLKPGQQLGPWRVLHPAPEDRFGRADDASLVLLANLHQTRVLLCSDLGRAGQRLLLERYPELRADIVISGLPAADEPLSTLFLQAIQPRLIIVGDALLPARARASRALQQRLAAQHVPVLYAHQTGAITLAFKPRQTWTIKCQNTSAE